MVKFEILFILFQILLISKAFEISNEFDNEYEEANLIIKLENWSSTDPDPSASFEFSLGKKLFGQDFVWELSARKYDFVQMTGIAVSEISGHPVDDRVLQTTASILNCQDGSFGPSSIFSPFDFSTGAQAAFRTQDIDMAPYVCPQDWVRFSVNFKIYRNETLMYRESAIISNEAPFEVTNTILPNFVYVDMKFSTGTKLWSKSSSWHFAGPSDLPIDQFMGPYIMTLESTDFASGSVFAAGWFEVEQDFTLNPKQSVSTIYIFFLEEYVVGQSVLFDLSHLIKNNEDIDNNNKAVIHVELYWETFGENARFSDYIPYDGDRFKGKNVQYIYPQLLKH